MGRDRASGGDVVWDGNVPSAKAGDLDLGARHEDLRNTGTEMKSDCSMRARDTRQGEYSRGRCGLSHELVQVVGREIDGVM